MSKQKCRCRHTFFPGRLHLCYKQGLAVSAGNFDPSLAGINDFARIQSRTVIGVFCTEYLQLSVS